MNRVGLFIVALTLLLSACNSNKVRVRGEVKGLTGSVKLLAELPGQAGLSVIGEDNVEDGKIDISTEAIVLPARVWVDIASKTTLEYIIDSKDQTWIEGNIKFPTEIDIVGSGLEEEYNTVRKLFKEKYDGPLADLQTKIDKIEQKEKLTPDQEVILNVQKMRADRINQSRFNYSISIVEKNLGRELSMYLILDELGTDNEEQKRLFKKLQVENKESNTYKVLEQKVSK